MYEKKHALPNKKIHTPKGIARLTVTGLGECRER